MTPQDFIRKWKDHALTERASAQEHFIDLCRLFDHPTPAEADPKGEEFAFEKGASITGGGDGWADVWKKGYFAWEYKKRRRNLDEAMVQLTRYAAALEHPPLLVVCDTIRFQIVTTWTNLETRKFEFELEDLLDPDKFKQLRAVFHDPDALKPKRTRAMITKEAADKFQTISDALQQRHPDREAVAHFVNQLVFCFFADSVKLLPEGLLRKLLSTAERRPKKSKDYFDKLFEQMEKGGEFDLTDIAHFNGGLFDGRRALPLEHGEIQLMFAATSLDWSLIDPTIFGTLFERFLDPDKRAQIGAHYTDADKIMMIVEPVILRPLRREWDALRADIHETMKPAREAGLAGRKGLADQNRKIAEARARATRLRDDFIARLAGLRVLDPACGSGNFLYLALQGVKDLEYRVINECETLAAYDGRVPAEADLVCYWFSKAWRAVGSGRALSVGLVSTNSIRGGANRRVLEPIAQAGAIFEAWSDEPWTIDGAAVRVSLVCFRAPRARGEGRGEGHAVGADEGPHAEEGAKRPSRSTRAGAATSSFETPAAPAPQDEVACRLDGVEVETINPDLTGRGFDITRAKRLKENEGVAFMGDTKGGAFDIPGELARSWLKAPLNPNGKANSDVLRPWVNGLDLTRRPRDMWIVDFGWEMSEEGAALYEEPFAYIREHVKPERDRNRRASYAKNWWRHVEPRPAMWEAIRALSPRHGRGPGHPRSDAAREDVDARDERGHNARYLATPRVAKHRLFIWQSATTCADYQIIAIARDDDTTFGILHSRFHEAWSLRLGTWLGVGNDPRYTPTTTFETFPFPEGLTPNIPASDYANDPRATRIAKAAARLDELRRNWLNPPDLVEIVPEVVPGYPDRILPKDAQAAAVLKTRTLTNLYNERPQWLVNAHAELDRAVAAAYGWPEDISIEDALARLLDLNLARAGG
ncbi:hypothetical protein AMST5_03243 [freshwater sediment metagenome]|uniref:site-specific DNA-methyltransferase (adenine-specific) n=1 Tax=freshwater sediment metagenome TaxID=556182 RepID=A0AA48M1I6_9ZZZZ